MHEYVRSSIKYDLPRVNRPGSEEHMCKRSQNLDLWSLPQAPPGLRFSWPLKYSGVLVKACEF